MNCLTAISRAKFSQKIERKSTYPERLIHIQESKNFLKFIWEELQTMQIETDFGHSNKISESKILRTACIEVPTDTKNNIIEVLNYDHCPNNEIFTNANQQAKPELNKFIYFPLNKIFYKTPVDQYVRESSYLNNPEIESIESLFDSKVLFNKQINRIYIKQKNGNILKFEPRSVWKNKKYFRSYISVERQNSDRYWIKDSVELPKVQTKDSLLTVLIFKSYKPNQTTGSFDLFTEIILLDLKNENWKNKTITFANYEIERKTKFGIYPLLIPLTIPVDILTAPIQLAFLGFNHYVYIISCSLGFTCKTALG